MGKSYLAGSSTKELNIDGETIVIKKFSYGTQKKIMSFGQTQTASAIDTGLEESIVSWTLTDDANEKLPINKETFNKLTASFIDKLYKEIFDFNDIKAEEIKK
jgi:DNA-binding sugar fermentation-stimulating protein